MSAIFTPEEVEKHLYDVAPNVVRTFCQYHIDNPNLWELLLKFARQLKAAGRDSYSIASLFERIRWHAMVETKGDQFKLNNNYKACYARMLMAKHPEFQGMFELRASPGTVPMDL